MFRDFVQNTLISLVAYGMISIIGLVVVSVLISAYGLLLYGLIVLARLWLPTGILGLVDLGVGETATLSIARARSTSEFEWAGGRISWLGLFAIVIGGICGIALYVFGDILGRLQGVSLEHREEFASILRWTAVALPILFASMVAEGIVKGFEKYFVIRAIEVLTSLANGIGSFLIVWFGGAYVDIAYMFVAVSLLRAAMSILAASHFLRRASISVGQWHQSGPRDCWQQMRLAATSKVLSTLQMQGPPLLASVLVGPAGLGVYDVLARLPRFAKSVLGLVNSALLPFGARLEAGKQAEGLRRLGEIGLPIVAVLSMPPLMAAATFSYSILLLWIGPDLSKYWPWQALMFLVPMMTVLVNFGGAALFTRKNMADRMNRLLLIQLSLQLIITLSLVTYFQERALILGQVVAMSITFYWQLRLVFCEQGLNAAVARHLVIVAGIGMLLFMACLPFAKNISSAWHLVAAMVFYIASYLLLMWWILPDQKTRRRIIHILMRRTGA